jgi:filamentous hemagglutinin family protein
MSPWRPVRRVLLASTALVPLGLAPAIANPNGPQVVGGAASVSGVGTSTVTVTQTSDRAIINWREFNIGAGERTQFFQPSSTSVALNRVTGGLGPSLIDGVLTANGRIFLINPDGVLIGRGATINTAGFLATTHDITNTDFMAGRYNFSIAGRPDASIVNHGNITASHQGFAALVAPGVRNTGTITATFGKIGLASGNGFSLDLYGDKLITLSVSDSVAATVKDVGTGQPLSALVHNEGKLKATGGRVELTAVTARKIVDSVINNTGVIEARSIGRHNGKIVLGGPTAQTKLAGAPTQTVKVSGKLSVAGKKKGGKIEVAGENIEVTGAAIDASGQTGGGQVLIGGDVGGGKPNAAVAGIAQAQLEGSPLPTATTVSVDAASIIDASAKGSGDGGKVVVWSDQATSFAGTITATGGATSGNGGFVEVSGKQWLGYTGFVDTRAPFGSWGTLLLDPWNITIQAGSTSGGGSFSGGTWNPTATSTIGDIELLSQLGSGNVVIATGLAGSAGGDQGNITVNVPLSWNSASILRLVAAHDIVINNSITATSGGLTLSAQNEITAPTASINVGKFTLEQGAWKQVTSTLPAFAASQDFRITGGSFLRATGGDGVNTPYEIVDVYGLQGIGSSGMLDKSYRLTQDINAAVTANWAAGFAPIGNAGNAFTGVFDGQSGNEIDALTIKPVTNTVSQIGLFGFVGSAGSLQHVHLTNVAVTANPNVGAMQQYVGTVAGVNTGTISVSSATGTINGGAVTGLYAGGLVGMNGNMNNNTVTPGTISFSSAGVDVTTGDGANCTSNCTVGFNTVGGLVGVNPGTISDSFATGTINVGANTFAGGLAGSNQTFFGAQNAVAPTIQDSYATGNVTATGLNVEIGGLVGYNSGKFGSVADVGTITDSRASGNVTANANITTSCNAQSSCEFVNAGGLVGFNQGLIAGTVQFSGGAPASGSGTYATGAVSVGSQGIAGGLVGQNDGIITNTLAEGAVTGAAGLAGSNNQGRDTTLGGLVGQNHGIIDESQATGNVGSINTAYLSVGGLVGHNGGSILDSNATGQVQAGDNSQAGGLAAGSEANDFSCNNCNLGIGHNNLGAIADSSASGSVTVGAVSLAGGLVGSAGLIVDSTASGGVTGGNNSILGGFVGVLGPGDVIAGGQSSGAVTGGSTSWIGGFAGVNAGLITSSLVTPFAPSSSTGAVQGDANSVIGGFVGLNIGKIEGATTAATATVTGTGANNVIGGLVGANFGRIVDSDSAGDVAGGANNVAGSLVGANGAIANVQPGLVPGSTFPLGVIDNQSIGTGLVNGTVGPQVGTYNLAALPPSPSILSSCDDELCQILKNPPLVQNPTEDFNPPDNLLASPLAQLLLQSDKAEQKAEEAKILIALSSPPASPAPAAGTQGNRSSSNQSTGTGGRPNLAPPQQLRPVTGPDGERFSSIPPPGETRFLNNEVVLQVGANISQEQITAVTQRLGLSVIASQTLGSLNRTAFRFRIGDGRSVRDVIRALEANSIVAVAQPNYQYKLAQQTASIPPDGGVRRGDPSQYMMGKLHLDEVHRISAGKDIIVAVIDSEVDGEHSELVGVIAERYATVGDKEKPHAHGTAMVGAISSRDRLLGVAPSAKILAVRAFSETASSADGTTFNIIKALDWAVSQGARVVNMSFAGPHDPSLARALKAAYDKGVVLIAAAGNAGPKSPPLFPGADTNVIAVTATDSEDRLFRQANRGPHVAVAAPGVEILAPAPEASYQLSTGTSIATAHVSGVVALMLERDATLTPEQVRQILESTAADLGPKGRDPQFGWGLVNPQKALTAVTLRLKGVDASKARQTPAAQVETTGNR